MRLENGSAHIGTVECSPRAENNLMKEPELRTQLFFKSLTAEFSRSIHQIQREEDFVPISIANRNDAISHSHRLEELVEVSPQKENEYIDHSKDISAI
ncbi:unnamed protein product [Ceratitis capitata]|uniref:(Mediterranean fruit fly) hypothetical protein n=1 Tax=Ceratitis capitata TaxID=7213 RepID=A0A811UVS7_CERCA|nr:unnamed protein product [Ceratitis capitata]